MWINLIPWFVCAYLVGSISTAIITCWLMGKPDPRGQGSHNPGATNVLRVGGKKAAAFTLLGDLFKGFLPMLVAQQMAVDDFILAGVMLAAFLGHLYPIFFRLQGGKGVATGMGVLWGLSWQVGLAMTLSWLTVALLSRLSSFAALVSFLLAPCFVWYFQHSLPVLVVTVVLSVLLFWRHRSNIQKLIAGKENRFTDEEFPEG